MQSFYCIDVDFHGFIVTVRLMMSPCGLTRFDFSIIFKLVFCFS